MKASTVKAYLEWGQAIVRQASKSLDGEVPPTLSRLVMLAGEQIRDGAAAHEAGDHSTAKLCADNAQALLDGAECVFATNVHARSVDLFDDAFAAIRAASN